MEPNLFVLDFETTGLNPYLDNVIELAIKKLSTDHHYQVLVKPPELPRGLVKYIPPHITKITNITDRMIENTSVIPEIAVHNMFQYINNHSTRGPIYIISHNGTTFDFIILKKLIKDHNISPRIVKRLNFIDTLLVAKSFMKDQRFRQRDLCKKYDVVNDAEHRALGDVDALEQIYKALCHEYSLMKCVDDDYYLNHPNELMSDLLIKVS